MNIKYIYGKRGRIILALSRSLVRKLYRLVSVNLKMFTE